MAPLSGNSFPFSLSEIVEICGVDLSTARRWRRRASYPPPYALKLLQVLLERDIGCFHPAWKGWRISGRGELCSPENWIATPGDVMSIQLTQMQLGDYRRENQFLKGELARLDFPEEQPLPENWSWSEAQSE